MCSRFDLNVPARELVPRFGLTAPPPLRNETEVRPTDPALVVPASRLPLVLRWGLVVSWDKRPVINARSEDVARRPTFRRLLGSRCLVPATSWFEWRKADGRKLKNTLRLAHGRPFALAGLFEDERFVILTRPAAPAIAHIHDRMPVVLPAEAEAHWLSLDLPPEDIAEILAEEPGEIVAVEAGADALGQKRLFD